MKSLTDIQGDLFWEDGVVLNEYFFLNGMAHTSKIIYGSMKDDLHCSIEHATVKICVSGMYMKYMESYALSQRIISIPYLQLAFSGNCSTTFVYFWNFTLEMNYK